MKKALITGITGQDGAYLADFLLEKGYQVHGIKRRSSLFNTQRVDHIYQDPHSHNYHFRLHYGDLTDASNLIRIIQEVQPDEIYNLGAMSHVRVSFDMPEYTADTNALGTLRILEAIRLLGLTKKTKFYQASTSEMFGNASSSKKQNEQTPFSPQSPYAAAKIFAHHITQIYREAYGMFAANGILFNHESPIRGETFVTRKITRAVAKMALGLQKKLYLGNLDAQRDWGHAKDYVRAMWLMLQQPRAKDFVIATGNTMTVRDFLQLAFKEVGVSIAFSGKGLQEQAYVVASTQAAYHFEVGKTVVHIDQRYFRPAEVNFLQGDASKATAQLGWRPTYSVTDLIHEMVQLDLALFASK